MEHIIVTELADGFVLLTPDAGYKLYHETSERYHSEAVVPEESMRYFTAVKVAEPTDEDPISAAEALRIITGM